MDTKADRPARSGRGWVFWTVVTIIVVFALVYLASSQLTGSPSKS